MPSSPTSLPRSWRLPPEGGSHAFSRYLRGFRLEAEELLSRGFRLQAEEWRTTCSSWRMGYAYPPHDPRLSYLGKQHYFLTFCTDSRKPVFIDEARVSLVRTQILRAAAEKQFETTAYCFMPDHLHLIVAGLTESSDARRFIRLAKQYSGYYFKQRAGVQLWQRYGFERVIREDAELALTIGYVIGNPVRDGLVRHPTEYPFIGSERYSLSELLAICEYEVRGSFA